MHAQLLIRVRLFATPWTAVHQTPLPMGFPRQGFWSASPLPIPGDLLDPGIEPVSPAWQMDSLPHFYFSLLQKVKKGFDNNILHEYFKAKSQFLVQNFSSVCSSHYSNSLTALRK